MKCQGVMEYMQRFLDHDLSKQEQDNMRNHLEQCTSCAEMFGRMNRLSNELVQLPKVVPPFSIVDSIMPKLDEIDRQRHAAESKVESLTPWQKFKRSVSIRHISGIAAACLMLVIVIVQGPHWFNSGGSFNNSNSARPESEAGISGSVTESSAQSMHISSANRTSGGADDEGAVQVKTDERASLHANQYQANVDSSDVNSKSRAIVPNGKEGTDLTDPIAPEYANAASEHTTGSEQSRSIAVEDSEPFVQISAFHGEFSEMNPVLSPDGHFSAFAERTDAGLQIIVLNHEGERIYASPVKQALQVSAIVWSEDGASLDYSVFTDDAQTQYTIDVVKRMEVQK